MFVVYRRFRITRLASFAFSILLCTCAHAQASSAECFTQDFWIGTVGAVPVHMSFEDYFADGRLVGRSYYRNSLQDLVLAPEPGQAGRWRETDSRNRTTGRLVLSCDGDNVRGEWRSTDGARVLPVAATRAKAGQYSDARFSRNRPKATLKRLPNGREVELLEFRDFPVTGVRLRGTGSAIRRLNDRLWNAFLALIEEGLVCTAANRVQGSGDGAFAMSGSWDVIEWNDRFVLLESTQEGYCAGAAHPSGGSGTEVIRLDTGETEDTSKWLRDDYAKDIYNHIAAESPLGRLLTRKYRSLRSDDEGVDECVEAMFLSSAGIRPTHTGFTFSNGFPYALTPCEEPVPLSFAEVAPFLSPRGKEVMDFFQRGR